MRYRILGTTQAFRPDGTAVTLGGARLRSLLTVLALRAGRTVPTGLLVEEVWAGDPPADATGALQALIGRLRRALGADAVLSAEGGYRLAAAPDDIDLHRFERLTADGLRALADGDAAKAAAVLEDALALWEGPCLADLPSRAAEAARWETRLLDARRGRLTALLGLGRADEALPELTALCDAHPLDEPLQVLRLRALHATGRTAEALAAYDAVRRLLADRLGSDPGPALRALHGELLTAGTAGPTATSTASPAGAGPVGRSPAGPAAAPYRAAVTPPHAPAASRPAAQAPAGNLRARLTSFVGRERDIERIRQDLAEARLVTLVGLGGAGKTRLSQEAAEGAGETAPDGVWLAELAPVDTPEAVPEAVLTAVGARETVLRGAGAEELRAVSDRHDDPVARLAEHCARRRMLLILDNCEHVVDAAARLADELLARCPGLTVLATSREPLGVPGEVLHPVEPLPEPAALRLLADRGAAARPGFRVEDDPEACAEICRRLDGLPLAIELAAARLRMLTPRQIADRLDDRFRLLTSGSRTVLPRQQTLRAVVDWSWDLLDDDERDVLCRLSVFAGGCDLAAAEAVCGPAAFDALASLVDKSLVVAEPSDGGAMRYRLLETVAEYAAERLDETGRRHEAERAHLTYYRELARTAEPLLRGTGQRAAIALLQREYENLRTALRRAVAARDAQEALCLVLSLGWYWQMRDLRLEARSWSAEVMALGPDPFAGPAVPAEPVWQRVTDAPPPYNGEVLAEAWRGAHLIHLACMDTELDAWQRPEAQHKLRIIAETYRPGMPQTCRPPGAAWFFAVLLTGDMERVRTIFDASVRTCREHPGFEWELAMSLSTRANLTANRIDWAGDATRDADESLEIFERLGDAWGAAEALSARGEAYERRGEFGLAAADYERAIARAERLGARAQVAVLTARLGAALLEAGRHERGEALLREVVRKQERTQNEALPAALLFLAGWLAITDRTEESRALLHRLREECRVSTFPLFDGFILIAESWVDTVEGRHREALKKAAQALERAREQLARSFVPQMSALCLLLAASALAGADGGVRARDAARCLGAGLAQLPPGHVPNFQERAVREHVERAVRAALTDEEFAAARAEGAGLSLEEAAALVRTAP